MYLMHVKILPYWEVVNGRDMIMHVRGRGMYGRSEVELGG